MSPETAGQVAQEMVKVHDALIHARRLVRCIDDMKAALRLEAGPADHSALLTSLEQAEVSAERVQTALRVAARPRRGRS